MTSDSSEASLTLDRAGKKRSPSDPLTAGVSARDSAAEGHLASLLPLFSHHLQ